MTSSAPSRSRAVRWLAAPALAFAALTAPQAAGLASAAPGLETATPGGPCSDVEVVFSRGTFEAPGIGDTGQAFVDALTPRLGGKSLQVYGVDYPASLDFGQAAGGVADATREIQSIADNCPNTKIVLGGYSQGAAVAGYSTFDTVPAGIVLPDGAGPIPAKTASHVKAVVLFGTPGQWVLDLVDRGAPPITVGSRYTSKTLQLCAEGDPVCFPGGTDRAAHSTYKFNGMADQAADFAATKLTRS